MRILMLSRDASGLDPASRTATRWRLLRDSGAEVEIIISSTFQTGWEENGLRVKGTGGRTLPQRLWRLYRLARARAIMVDYLTAQDPFELGLIAWRVSRLAAKRFEIQDHGAFFSGGERYEPLAWLRSWMPRFLARRAGRIRTVNPESLKWLNTAGFGEKTYFLPLAADARFRQAVRRPEPNLIVSVARLVPFKRVDLLLQTFAVLKVNTPSAKLVMIGDGPLRSSLEGLTQRLGIAQDVTFIRETDPLPWFERAALFALLSSHEGWGVAAVEAALTGVPVLMTSGCGEWLEERGRARTTLSADPKEIARLMGEMLVRPPTPSFFSNAPVPEEVGRHQIEEWRRCVNEKPRSLICVQAVDPDEPLMGFFVDWLQAFRTHSRAIVCALRVAAQLPDFADEIEVHHMRPTASRSRLAVLWNVARVSWHERFRYEAVFVRQDPQYAACLGWWWRLLGKRVVFWYTHYTARGPWFWLGALWAHEVVTAVDESNPLASSIKLGHHINTDVFTPRETPVHVKPSLLLFGRVSPVKRIPWILQTIGGIVKQQGLALTLVGSPDTPTLRAEVEAVLPTHAEWRDAPLPSSQAVSLYRDHGIFINATPGSMDKTILEAASCGCIVLAASTGMKHGLPPDLGWLQFSSADELRQSLERVLAMTPEERREVGRRVRAWVIARHSLQMHIPRLVALLYEKTPRPLLRQRFKRLIWRITKTRELPTGLSVLMFHTMDGKGSAAWDAYRFQALVSRLMSRKTAFVRCKDIWNGRSFETAHGVMLTLDDATEDFYAIASVLRREQLCMALFAPSGLSTLSGSEHISRRVLNREELQAFVEEGIIEVGGHGVSHTPLRGMEARRLLQETENSYVYVQALNKPGVPAVFAYPKGKCDLIAKRSVAAAGFVASFGVQPGRWTQASQLFHIPRIPVLGWMNSRDGLDRLLSERFV